MCLDPSEGISKYTSVRPGLVLLAKQALTGPCHIPRDKTGALTVAGARTVLCPFPE